MSQITYPGSELEVFAYARNWKRYVRDQIAGHLQGDILEVGAGIGSNTLSYLGARYRRWVCLEPDPGLAARIRNNDALSGCEVVIGSVADVPVSEKFNSILYMDVLEHIADDAGELREAARRLQAGGSLVVLAPAHQALFTPFDRAIGHYRRYDAAMLRDLTPQGLVLERLRYLDAVGICASLGNRLFLSSASPSVSQIKTWDRFFVPLSRCIDPLLAYRLGKSVLAIWRARDTF